MAMLFSYEKKFHMVSVFLHEKIFMGDFIGPTSVNISCLFEGQKTSNVVMYCYYVDKKC